ncbi:Fe2+-dependent dioxygenase [Ectothiorhodospiraceae bacterium WFHF3C12]|nr:Fe2+-dependent dioxygenase [Ectothiorhodospiraceae bacterium WFHF3C12]
MILCIADVLDADSVARVRAGLARASFRDGRETAGWHARLVKHNQQADSRTEAVESLRSLVDQAVAASPLFQTAARPARQRPVMFSRYESGMSYGAHVDDAVMGQGGDRLRTDLSFTLFLCDPDSYDGGELIMDTTAGEQSYKLPAGAMVLYPSSTLHRVDPVTRGERLAAVGWVQSQVRDPRHRELLFDLETARRRIFETQGKTPEFDLVSKSLANLLRMWVES